MNQNLLNGILEVLQRHPDLQEQYIVLKAVTAGVETSYSLSLVESQQASIYQQLMGGKSN